jgi:hypothetical protein
VVLNDALITPEKVKLIVVSDFDTTQKIEVQKNLTELPMKFFVKHVDALRQGGLPYPDQNPTDAQRY